MALLLLGPIAIMPGALNRFVFIKVALVAAGAAVAAFGPARGRLPRRVAIALGLGAAWLAIAALAGAAPLAQAVGLGPRYEGLAVLPVYLLAGWSGARILGPGRGAGAITWLGRLLAVAALCVGVVAVLETAGLRPLSSNVYRPGSLLGNASDLGAFAVLIAGPLGALALSSRDRLVQAGAVAALATVALSASRGALVGALAAAAVLILLARTRAQRVVLVGGLVGIGLLTLAVPLTRSRALGTSPLASKTVSGRFLLWGETVTLVARHPLLGVGPSGFVDAIVGEHNLTWQQQVGPANPPDSPHNWLLQAAVAGGIPLLLLALLVAAYTGYRGLRNAWPERSGRAPPLHAGLLAGLVGYGSALMFHLTSPGPTPLAAFFGGVLLATDAGPQLARARRYLPVAIGSLASLLAIALLAAAAAEIPLRLGVQALERGQLARGDHYFSLAKDLRPWDVEVAMTAGHAYAVLALDGVRSAAPYGQVWLNAARAELPGNEQIETDLATVAESQGHLRLAQRILVSELRVDRFNPQLLLRYGVVAAEQHQYRLAGKTFLEVSRIDPTSPAPWKDLSVLYGKEGLSRSAARASAMARRLLSSAG